MKPVLFLDIDGVLNSRAFKEERAALPADPLYAQLPQEDREADRKLDPAAMARLNRIVTETDCLVVISSSWRVVYSLCRLERMFRRRGYEHRLFGTTPRIWLDTDDRSHRERGSEIKTWLDWVDSVNGRGDRYGVFAIVDDDSDMGDLMGRLVQTNNEVGLTDEDAARLIALLRGGS